MENSGGLCQTEKRPKACRGLCDSMNRNIPAYNLCKEVEGTDMLSKVQLNKMGLLLVAAITVFLVACSGGGGNG